MIKVLYDDEGVDILNSFFDGMWVVWKRIIQLSC